MAAHKANDATTIETCIQEESERLGFELDSESQHRLATYFALLERWGQRIRLSGSREASELIQRHLADALHLHRALCGLEAEREATGSDPDHYIDVGSGGGLPALPLLALEPQRHVTLVEARSRKATFLRSAVHELGIRHCAVFDERLEQLVARDAFEQPFGAAWSLATFAPPEWLHRAIPLIAGGGTVFVFVAGDKPEALSHHELEPNDAQHWQLADGRHRQLLAFHRRQPAQ